MSRSKRYATIPLAESTACEAAFEQMEAAWQSGDVERISQALEGLKAYFIYSNYPWYKRWNKLKPQVVRALWRGLPRPRFWQVDGGRNLHSFEFHSALEPLADELSERDLKELCQRYEFPNKRQQPQLWARFIEEPSEEFSRWLIDKVETDLQHEARLEAKTTHASKSSFGLFHWQPYRPNVAAPIEILGRRRDDAARVQTRQWLRELPFASDRSSIEALLRGMFENPHSELEGDLEAALERFSTPSDLRLLLLKSLETLSPEVAIASFFADLRGPLEEDAREGYLETLESRLPEWKSQHEALVAREMATVDSQRWSSLMRGYWASVAERNGFPLSRPVGIRAKLADKIVEFFDSTRPGVFGGCIVGLPLVLFIGFVLQTALSLALGPPSKPLMAANGIATIVWAICVSVTFTSDFLHGGEARRSRLKMALCSFGSFAAMLIIGVGSRIV